MAAYGLRNYRDIVLMNVAQLVAGASPAAIVRFAMSLSFEGHPPFQQTGSVTLDDLAVSPVSPEGTLIAFPRYSRELIDTAEFARGASFTVRGITNNELSPLAFLCPLSLLVVVGELSFTDFCAAPIALLNALVAEVARRSRTRALGRLTQLDDLAAARGYFLGGRRAAEV